MAKTPKKFKGKLAENNTYTNERNVGKVDPLAINLLPGIFKTDINKKVFTAVVEDMFQPNVIENVNYNVGRPSGASTASKDTSLIRPVPNFLPTADNKKRQLEEGIITRRDDNNTYTLTSDNVALSQGFSNKHDNEPAVPVSVNDFPINPDKFINWSNYVWINITPVVYLTGSVITDTTSPINVYNDIIGKQSYTTPLQANNRTLPLMNGMKISFKKEVTGREDVNGDISETHIADGTDQLDITAEVDGDYGYNKQLIRVYVNGTLKVFNTDYTFLPESIKWKDGYIPNAGDVISITIPDFYVNATTHARQGQVNLERTFLVDGVGSPSGIRLLGGSHQDSQTVYSNQLASLWDQTGITWDKIAWEGDIKGINEKHYVVQQLASESRNAFSRVNSWMHLDTLNEICNFLNINQRDVVDARDIALRPIVEFENSLEMFNHGTSWKHTMGAVVDNNSDATVDGLIGQPILKVLVDVLLGTISPANNQAVYEALRDEDINAINTLITQTFVINQRARTAISSLALKATRLSQGQKIFAINVLWLKDDAYKNKIINFRFDNVTNLCTGYQFNTLKDKQSFYISEGTNAYFEYAVHGATVMPAQTRLSKTHIPLWRIYDRNQNPLDQWETLFGIIPSVQHSTIIKFKDGEGETDKESGFKLKFDSSNFATIANSTAPNKPVDIMFDYTLQDSVKFTDIINEIDAEVPGPINFRRYYSPITTLPQSINDGLSTGVMRAWYRLKSWASSRINGDSSVITLSGSAWPTYEWIVVPDGDDIKVQHTDTLQGSVHNIIVGATNETLTLKTTGLTDVLIYDDTGTLVINKTANSAGIINLDLPTNMTPGFYTATFGPYYSSTLTMMVINVTNDPRAPIIAVNGFASKWTPEPIRDINNLVTSVKVHVNVISNDALEIIHQGEFLNNANAELEHCTAIPGLAYNPEQNIAFVEGFTPTILSKSMEKNIKANVRDNANWNEGFKLPALDGSYTVDISAIRSMWATQRLAPNLNEAVINRSMSSWRWHRRFIKLIEEYNNTYEVTTTNSRDILNKILDKLNDEVNINTTDAESGMVFSTTNMLTVTYSTDEAVATFPINIGSATAIDLGEYDPDHVYVYVDNIIQIDNYTINVDTNSVIFDEAIATGKIVTIYYRGISTPLLSGMPASPTKLGLSPLTKPGLIRERWGMYDRFLIQRHDGSKVMAHQDNIYSNPDPRDYLILELEKRIYASCAELPQSNKDAFSLYLNPEASPLRSLAEVRWFASNNIDFRDRSQDFDATDPWTWNYSGKSWRGMYIQLFGTYQIDSRPWEVLGFINKPDWWDTYYSWGNTTKRNALENALTSGLISEPGTPVKYNYRVKRIYADGFPVTSDSLLMHPQEWIGLTPTTDAAGAPWEIGSYGVWEDLWARSSAGAFHQIFDRIGNPDTVNEFIEKGINPYINVNKNNSTEALGTYSIYPDVPWIQLRPTIGIGAMLYENSTELNFPGSQVITELENLGVVLMFGMGGFSNQEARFKMPQTKIADGTYVPEEDFNLSLDNGIAVNSLRYSAVRLEREDSGFRVYGFDPEYRYFNVVTPIKEGKTGSTSGTYQSKVTTDTDTFILFKQYNTATVTIPYGTKFETKQELYEFFTGMQELQQRNGLVFETTNARGTIGNWEQVALDAMTWISENWGTDTFWLGGPIGNSGFTFEHELGHLDRLNSNLTERGKIFFADGAEAQPNDLLISRNYEKHTDLVEVTADKQVTFIDFSLRNYDHIFFFNNSTRFGDVINNNQFQNRIPSLKMIARRTRGWDGRPFAQGVIVTKEGMLPGFESLTDDVLQARNPEKSQFNPFLNNISNSDIIPGNTGSIINEFISDDSVDFAFKQGLASASGTNLAINALFRNSAIDIPGSIQNLEINEQWMFTDGEFGKLGNRKVWEIEIRSDDMTSSRQIIRFKEGRFDVDLRSDNIIDILKTDNRWVTRENDINFKTIPRSRLSAKYVAKNKWLPSAGVGNLLENDYQCRSLNELNGINITTLDSEKFTRLAEIQSFSKFGLYIEGNRVWNNGLLYQAIENVPGGVNTAFDPTQWTTVTEDAISNPPSVWLSDYNFTDFTVSETGETEVSWNIIKGNTPVAITEICANIDPALEESKVTFPNAHQLSVDDIVLILGTTEEPIRTFHKVTKVIDSYNILIPVKVSTQLNNLVAITMLTTKGKTQQDLPVNFNSIAIGTKFYLEPDSTAQGEYTVYEFDGAGWILNEEATTLQGDMVDTSKIDSMTLLDGTTGHQLTNIELFDPYKGFTIDEVAQYIDYRQGADPAVYNINEFGTLELDATTFWESSKIGKLWWDTNKLRYAEYEQRDDVEYRANYWGEQFSDSEVEVFEWVSSIEEPTIDSNPNARLDFSDGDGVIRFTETDEYNENGALITTYYFWEKNVTDIPSTETRTHSAKSIQTILDNPDVAGVSWASPIANNALVVSNIDSFLSTRGSVILRIVEREDSLQQHVNSILVSEGKSGSVIPEYLFRRLKTGIAGRDNYRKTHALKTWAPNTVYAEGDYIINFDYSSLAITSQYNSRDIPIINFLNDIREEVESILRPNYTIDGNGDLVDVNGNILATSTDGLFELKQKMHRPVLVTKETGYTSSNSFIDDLVTDQTIIISSATALQQNGGLNGEYLAVIPARRRVPDVKLHPLRRYGNAYIPQPQTWYSDIRESRRNFVYSANKYLLQVNAINKTEYDKHLITYQPIFGPYIKDLTPYWEYVDYLASTYVAGSEQVFVNDLAEITSLTDDITIFGLLDSNGELERSFNKTGLDIELAFQRNGTIQFLDTVWDGSLGDAWDTARWDKYAWDEDGSEILESLITALREDLFTSEDVGFFNLLYFDMVKEALRQIPQANWAIKTTYLDVSKTASDDLNTVSVFYDKLVQQVQKYINEVKPFHSKVINFNNQLSNINTVDVAIDESVTMRYLTDLQTLTDEDGNTITTEDGFGMDFVNPNEPIALIEIDPDGETVSY